MGRTRKPCPGCGRADHDRKPDSVCDRCKRDLIVADELRKRVMDDPEKVLISCHDPGYPSIHFGRNASHKSDALGVLCELAGLVGEEPIPHNIAQRHWKEVDSMRRFGSWGAWYGQRGYQCEVFPTTTRMAADRIILIRQDVLEKLKDLRGKMIEELKHAFAAGEASGRNMLKQLSTGKLSIGDFNEIEEKS